MARRIILLTGQPGIGKSTIVAGVIEKLAGKAGGFYTREVREQDMRTGFEIVTLAGASARLATRTAQLTFPGEFTLEDYKVNPAALTGCAVPALKAAMQNKQIVIIDEIGPMEIFSTEFCEIVTEIVEHTDLAVFGTIVARPWEFANALKLNPQVTLIHVTLENRNHLPEQITAMLMQNIVNNA